MLRERGGVVGGEVPPVLAARDVDRAPAASPADERCAQLERDPRRREQVAVAGAALGRPLVAWLRMPTGTRRAARLANVLTSVTKYSLATMPAPASAAAWGVNTPSLISSCGASLVISRVCGSSVCQHVASQSITRRSRAATSPKYCSRGSPRRPSSATSSTSRSTAQRPAGMTEYDPCAAAGCRRRARNIPATEGSTTRAPSEHATSRQANRPRRHAMTTDTTQTTSGTDRRASPPRWHRSRSAAGEGEALWFLGTLATIKASSETTAGRVARDRARWPRAAAARRCTSTTARTSGST